MDVSYLTELNPGIHHYFGISFPATTAEPIIFDDHVDLSALFAKNLRVVDVLKRCMPQ